MAEMKLALAPEQLWQAINPWSFFEGAQLGNVTVNIGTTPRPDIETKVLDSVGSYGRQLGRIGDALEVLIAHFDQSALNATERDALKVLTGQLAEIRQIKADA